MSKKRAEQFYSKIMPVLECAVVVYYLLFRCSYEKKESYSTLS